MAISLAALQLLGGTSVSLKHRITRQNILSWPEIKVIAFEGVAQTGHYKVLYQIQQKKNTTHSAAITEMMQNKEFSDACIEYVNKPEVYKKCMHRVMEYHRSFANFELPTREADFVVFKGDYDDDESKIYFFIDEGIELDVDGGNFQLNRILIDHFTDTLLYNAGDGWMEYEHNNEANKNSICYKVSSAFRDYLAEKQLLER